MARYVAFLRGMNLGNRRIKNDALRLRFEELGFGDVATFRASGNVIFDADDGDGEVALTERIEAGLAKALGYEVPVFLRSAAEVAAIAAQQPFEETLVEASKGKLQVSLMLKKPAAKARKTVLALSTDEDRLALEGRELYWLPSAGTIDSDLDLKAIAAVLGPVTMRTKGTIDQIAAKHCAP
ncbi:MAG TPA: DUF1697 domain-containing protein [Solirubrobacterales bacterium]|jgi:uncharacterized protein (DUF1697 family)|nr:DUF1697 domain-containing protein [Solirubrobacterales bacterium]